jgi:hypothetical protein
MKDTNTFPGRRGPRRGRPRQAEERTTAEQRQRIQAWFAGRLTENWFEGPATVVVDDEGADADQQATAESARISGFREDTRTQRMRIAEEAQSSFDRHVSWGASCGSTSYSFTTLSVPAMTRLGLAERQVLDTLIDAGIARSRSEALAWCVRLVGRNEEAWINELRSAFEQVERVRSGGPNATEGSAPEGE